MAKNGDVVLITGKRKHCLLDKKSREIIKIIFFLWTNNIAVFRID